MKNKDNINEMMGTPPPQTSQSTQGKTEVTLSKKDFNDTTVQQNLAKLKDVSVNVVEESIGGEFQKLKFLSNFIDEKGQPVVFHLPINGQNQKFQLVWAVPQDGGTRELGVYSFEDEYVADDGVNPNPTKFKNTNDNRKGVEPIIYPKDYFEQHIAPKELDEENDIAQNDIAQNDIAQNDIPQETPQTKPNDMSNIGLGDFRFFLVNEKRGKIRKFKSVSEIATAVMDGDERFMSLKELKKYFDSRVFGSKNKSSEVVTESDEEIHAKAQKLMTLITTKIPAHVIESIKTNKLAQREVIASFAELIGVPRQGLAGLVSGLKAIANTGTITTPVTESKVIKTIKIKDIKND